MKTILHLCILTIMATLFSLTSSFAGGLWLYEQATPDMGRSAAGRAAAALDASTAGHNAAGMTKLDRSQMLTGFQGIIARVKFDKNAATTTPGGNGGDAGSFIPVTSFYYVHSVSDDLKLGLSVGSFFGLGLDYQDGWAGRYYNEDAELMSAAILPSVGYRLNDWLSVGAGVSMLYGKLTQNVAINNLLQRSDGRLRISENDIAYGFTLSMLVEPRDGTRFGLQYGSEHDLEFDDSFDLINAGLLYNLILGKSGIKKGSKAGIELTVPQQLMFSIYHEINNRLAIMANFGWQDYSSFGESTLTLSGNINRSLSLDRDMHDVFHYALGLRCRLKEKWIVSTGIAYDTSPASNSKRTPDLPLDKQVRLSAGLEYELNDDITIGGAYTYLDAGTARIKQNGGPLKGNLYGSYDKNVLHMFSINLSWKF